MTPQGDRKIWVHGEEAINKLSEGLRKATEVVGSTLGPAGRNVMIERKNRTPEVVDDGITALNQLILDCELENLAANSLVDAARHASETAGDGTSTTVVLTQAIFEACRGFLSWNKFVLGKKTPLEVQREIKEAQKVVVVELAKRAKQIKTKAEIKEVALTAYADETMADIVSEVISQVGENGTVIVEDGWGRETEHEVLSGMRFAGKFPAKHFANTPEEDMQVEDLPVLVTDFNFHNAQSIAALLPLYQEVTKSGAKGLVIVANKFERPALEQVVAINIGNLKNGTGFAFYLINAPSFTPGDFEDLAVYLGARYYSKENGDKPENCRMTEEMSIGPDKNVFVQTLGKADKIRITKIGDGIAIGGAGVKEAIDGRIADLKIQLADQKVKMIKARIEQRIASLASAVGIIKVASPSDAETEHIRLKTRNAVKSAQSAIAEGVVKGGGVALKEIAEALPENILTSALKAPNKLILENAGGELDMEGVFDSVKVVRTALEQACSQAWLLLTTGTLIAFSNQPDAADAAKLIADALKGADPKNKHNEDAV